MGCAREAPRRARDDQRDLTSRLCPHPRAASAALGVSEGGSGLTARSRIIRSLGAAQPGWRAVSGGADSSPCTGSSKPPVRAGRDGDTGRDRRRRCRSAGGLSGVARSSRGACRDRAHWAGASLLVPAAFRRRAVRAGKDAPLRAGLARHRCGRDLHPWCASGRGRRRTRGEDLGRRDPLRPTCSSRSAPSRLRSFPAH